MESKTRHYAGYIGAIKDGEASSKVSEVDAESPLQVRSKLKEAAEREYPVDDGWHSHATSSEEGIVCY